MADISDPNRPELVPPDEPETSFPIRFEQNLVPNIPSDVWRKLSQEQLHQLVEKIVEMTFRSQEQRFELERESAKREDSRSTRDVFFGTIVVVVGYGASLYLALSGQKEVALSISTPLTALVAVVIGRRLKG